MFDKLRQIEERYRELNRSLSDPAVIGQPPLYARTAKAAAELAETVHKFDDYKAVLACISEARHILNEDADREMREMAQAEVDELQEAVLLIQGRGAWSRLKFERGVHRVQRVPATESSGRIHTSTVTVAVLPEAEDVDIKVEEKDVQVDVYRSSGPGGQGVNTTDSAVRLTHLPTGLVVTCQDERSQLKNKARALEVLRSRLFDMELRRHQEEVGSARKMQVGTGERGSKIRTYNFRENRVTDHRIGLTLYNLDRILEGQLDPLIDALAEADAL